MKMDLCELIQYEKNKDENQMKKMFGDYCRNAEDDVYSELAEIEKNTYEGNGSAPRLPTALGFLGLLGEYIIGETLPRKKGGGGIMASIIDLLPINLSNGVRLFAGMLLITVIAKTPLSDLVQGALGK